MSQFNQQRGVGLIEVLVAVLLLSVAVLGFSALQLRAISATNESLVRTQAMSILRGLAENMRANSAKIDTYQTIINNPSSITDISLSSCRAITDNCTATQVAVKESKAAVTKLTEYGISVMMTTCPGTAGFSEVKCIVAAWDDTQAAMGTGAQACANADGTYKSGSTCIIIEAY